MPTFFFVLVVRPNANGTDSVLRLSIGPGCGRPQSKTTASARHSQLLGLETAPQALVREIGRSTKHRRTAVLNSGRICETSLPGPSWFIPGLQDSSPWVAWGSYGIGRRS